MTNLKSLLLLLSVTLLANSNVFACETANITCTEGNYTIDLIDGDNEGVLEINTTDFVSIESGGCPDTFLVPEILTYSCEDLGYLEETIIANSTTGEENSCTQAILLIDSSPPVANCSEENEVYLDSNGLYSLDPSLLDGGSTDNCQVTGHSANKTEFTCSDIGSHALELEVQDRSGNTDTCITTLTIVDNLPPTATCMDITVNLPASGTIEVEVLSTEIDDSSSDNCGNITLAILEESIFNCSHRGNNSLTLEATDDQGLTDSCTAYVDIQDVNDPVANCASEYTVYIDEDGEGTLDGSDLDNGSTDNCGISQFNANVTNFTCADIGSHFARLEILDDSGNMASCEVPIIVEDSIPPVATCLPYYTVNLTEFGNFSLLAEALDSGSYDNCGIADKFINVTTFTCSDTEDEIPVELTVVDNSGNSASCISMLTVNDEISPDPVCYQTLQVNLTENSNTEYTLVAEELDMNSQDNCGISDYIIENLTLNCSNVNIPINITLTVEDNSGNLAECITEVTAMDVTPPDANCFTSEGIVFLDDDGIGGIIVEDVDDSSTDNCSPQDSLNRSLSRDNFTCDDLGSIDIVLTVADEIGLSSSCIRTFQIEDDINPTAFCKDNKTIVLDSTGMGSLDADEIDDSSYDNCGIGSKSLSLSSFSCSDIGSHNVNLTITDTSGNTDYCSSTVIVRDRTIGIAQCNDLTLNLDLNGTVSVTPEEVDDSSTDNCSGSVDLIREFYGQDTFNCTDIGHHTIELMVIDEYDNNSTCTANIEVQDNIDPVLDNCPSEYNVTLDDNCEALTPEFSDFDYGYDNCEIVSLTQSPEANSTISGGGQQEVIVTAHDQSNNNGTCSIMVNKQDITPTVITCPATHSVTVNKDCKYILADLTSLASVDDNCPNVITQSPAIGTVYNSRGQYTVTLRATDPGQNFDECDITLNVEDWIAPQGNCPSNTVVSNYDVLCKATLSSYTSKSTWRDNCDTIQPQSIEQYSSSQLIKREASHAVRISAADSSGNLNNCAFAVIGGSCTCPSNMRYDYGKGVCVCHSPTELIFEAALNNCVCRNRRLQYNKLSMKCERANPFPFNLQIYDEPPANVYDLPRSINSDDTNPITIARPNTDSNPTFLRVRFSYQKSVTLTYGNLLGLRFPIGLFANNDPRPADCLIADSSGNYLESQIEYSTVLNSSVYCRLTDSAAPALEPGKYYNLIFRFDNVIASNFGMRSMSVFVTTSTELGQIILAHTIVGNAAQYQQASSKVPLLLESSRLEPAESCLGLTLCDRIYPNSNFNLVLRVVVGEFIPVFSRAMIVLNWSDSVDFSTLSVSSRAYNVNSNDPRVLALTEELTLSNFSNLKNSFVLSGFSRDLVQGRKLELVISGFSSRNSHLVASGFIAATVYWKNTNFIISYSQLNNVFSVSKFNLSFNPAQGSASWSGVAHPEFFDIYENGSWPLRFIFQVPKLYKGGYIKISHQRSANRIWNFIPSTCDFSDPINSSTISNEIGKRPVCYNVNTANQIDSEIFFKLPAMSQASTISVVVWGVAVRCSQNNYLDLMNVATNQSNSKGNFQFVIKIYSELDERDRVYFQERNLLAESAILQMYGTCFGNIRRHTDSLKDIYLDAGLINSNSEVVIYEEFSRFDIVSITQSTFNSQQIDRRFYYSSTATNRIINNQNLQFGISFPENLGGTDTANWIYNNLPMTTFKSSMTLQLSRLFVTSNSRDCRLRWLTSGMDTRNDSGLNYVSQTNSATNKRIDLAASNLNQQGGLYSPANLFVKPISIKTNTLNDGGAVFPKMVRTSADSTAYYEHLYFDTDCYKPIAPSNIRSIYNYLDFTYVISRNTQNVDTRTRIGRFIKLFAEHGVIRNPDENSSIGVSSQPFVFHNVNSLDRSSVCLLEVAKTVLDSAASRNSLILHLTNIELLNSDYTREFSRYPAAPILEASINVYASSIVYPFNLNNRQGFLDIHEYGPPSYIQKLLKRLYNSTWTSKASAESSYWAFLSSRILFTGISNVNLISGSNQNASKIYIPVKCTRGTTISKNQLQFVPQVASALALNYLGGLFTNLADLRNVIFDSSSGKASKFNTISMLNESPMILAQAAPQRVGVMFNSYISTSQSDRLFIYGISKQEACKQFSLFLNERITVDKLASNIKFNSNSVAVANIGNSDDFAFYYNSFRFNKAIFSTGSVNLDKYSTTNSAPPNQFYEGITRPSVHELIGGFPNNAVAFTCTNPGASTGQVFSNLNSAGDFEVLVFSSKSNTNWSATFTLDVSTQEVFLNDSALALGITFRLPTAVPVNGLLKFTSDSIDNMTLCSIRSSDNLLTLPCENDSFSLISCSFEKIGVVEAGALISLCCYNARSLPSSPSISSATLQAEGYTIASTLSQITTGIFTQSSASRGIENVIPEIQAIEFRHTNQENGIGIGYFTISLGRQAVRNMSLRITGDLSSAYINNRIPNCEYTYNDFDSIGNLPVGENLNNGEFLVERCIVSSTLTGAVHTIDLQNKNILYKCGLTLASSLVLVLWPIRVTEFSTIPNNKYSIRLGLGSIDKPISYTPNASTLKEFPASNISTQIEAAPAVTQTFNLCNLTSIFPRLVNSRADYTFEVDLSQTASTEINEITIIFSHRLFILSGSNVLCEYENSPVVCDWNKNFLNVRFVNALSNNKHLIKVIGIVNPILGSSNSEFICTANHFDPVELTRSNIIIGRGDNGISTYNPTSIGSLLFVQDPATALNVIDSRGVIPEFRMSFMIDTTQNLSNLPQTFTATSAGNRPVIIVSLPRQFNLDSLTDTSFAVNLTRMVLDNNQSNISNSPLQRLTIVGPSVSISSFSISRNRILITLSESDLVFDQDTVHFTLTLLNLPSPMATFSGDLSPFSITVMNELQSPNKIFRTFNNLNTQFSNQIASSLYTTINWYRGVRFNFIDSRKSVININENNSITVISGRYMKNVARIITSTVIGNQGETTVSLEDDTFRILPEEFILNTGLNREFEFEIACPCGSIPGVRYIRFVSSNSEAFYPLSPVRILVDSFRTSYTNLYLSDQNNGSPITQFVSSSGSLTDIFIVSEQKPFEPVLFTLVTPTGYTNMPDLILPEEIILDSQSSWTSFTIESTNSEVKDTIKFNILSNNNCYRFSGISFIGFEIDQSLVLEDLTDYDISNKFRFIIPTYDDETLNIIRFIYTSEKPNTFLFCALVCLGADFPADELITTFNPPESKNNFAHFTIYIKDNDDLLISFGDLYRGSDFKMRCILTNSAVDLDTSTAVTIIEYTRPETNEKVNISTLPTARPYVISFRFARAQPLRILNALIFACQNLIVRLGFINAGSIIMSGSRGRPPVGFNYEPKDKCSKDLAFLKYKDVKSASKGKRNQNNLLRYLQDTTPTQENQSLETVTDDAMDLFVSATQLENAPKIADIVNLMQRIQQTVPTTDALSEFIGETVQGEFTTELIQDEPIDFGSIVLTGSSYLNSTVSWIAAYNRNTTLLCYWRLSETNSTTALATQDIRTCQEDEDCGEFTLNSTLTVFENSVSNLTNGRYNCWGYCTNNIVGSQENTRVFSLVVFDVQPQVVKPEKILVEYDVDELSIKWITVSWMMLLLILL